MVLAENFFISVYAEVLSGFKLSFADKKIKKYSQVLYNGM